MKRPAHGLLLICCALLLSVGCIRATGFGPEQPPDQLTDGDSDSDSDADGDTDSDPDDLGDSTPEERTLAVLGDSAARVGACAHYSVTMDGSPTTTPVNLTLDSSGNGSFYQGASCLSQIVQLALPAGVSTAAFSYRSQFIGNDTLTVTGPEGFVDASIQTRIEPYLAFTGPSEALTNVCAGPFYITANDPLQAPLTTPTTLALAVSGEGQGGFFIDALCETPTSTLQIDAHASQSDAVYFKNAVPEQLTLAAELSTSAIATHAFNVRLPGVCEEAGAQEATPYLVRAGTFGNPHLICTSAQLNNIRNALDQSFRLEADINLSGYINNSFAPIGSSGSPFTGNLDGAGHTISGFVYRADGAGTDAPSAARVGFFSSVDGGSTQARIRNLSVLNAVVEAGVEGAVLIGHGTNVNVANVTVSGSVACLGECGLVAGTLFTSVATNIHSSGTVAINAGHWISGGLIGRVRGITLSQSSSTAAITAASLAGGIVGAVEEGVNVFTDVTFTGTFNPTAFAHQVGGIVGAARDGTVTLRITNATVTGVDITGSTSLGGVVGRASNTTVLSRVAVSNVAITGENLLGGIVGAVDVSAFALSESFADDVVLYSSSGNAGGAVGYLLGIVSTTRASGSVNGESGAAHRLGGLVGQAGPESVITNSYSTATVSTLGNYAGGLVGSASPTGRIHHSYSAGVPATLVGLVNGAAVVDCEPGSWTNDGIWVVSGGPLLRWQVDPTSACADHSVLFARERLVQFTGTTANSWSHTANQSFNVGRSPSQATLSAARWVNSDQAVLPTDVIQFAAFTMSDNGYPQTVITTPWNNTNDALYVGLEAALNPADLSSASDHVFAGGTLDLGAGASRQVLASQRWPNQGPLGLQPQSASIAPMPNLAAQLSSLNGTGIPLDTRIHTWVWPHPAANAYADTLHRSTHTLVHVLRCP